MIGRFGCLTNFAPTENGGKKMELKPFKCDNGCVYKVPKNHCVFCDHCTDIFYDYTNGPYMFICELDCVDFETCGKFEQEV